MEVDNLSSATRAVQTCILCKTDTCEKLTKLTDAGIATLRTSCEIRRNVDLLEYLDSNPGTDLFVHASCRKSFTRSSDLKRLKLQLEGPTDTRTLRSASDCFLFKTSCFFCGRPAVSDPGVRRVHTLELGDNVLATCVERLDSWAVEVQGRLEACIDLVAEEAIYHKACHSRFVNGLQRVAGETSCGRPWNAAAMKAFDLMCYRLETTCEQNIFTVEDLHRIMTDLCDCDVDAELYSVKHMKYLMKERYGDNIVFAEVSGRRNVVCCRDLCNLIVSDKWYEDRANDESTRSERIVKDAARLIASEIRDMSYSMDEYPSTSDMSVDNQEVIPPLLQLFMQSLVKTKLKQSSLAQAVIQAARPQSSIMPLLFGLGVQLDHEFGSEFLLMQLSRLGFCISYDEITRFKASVMQASSDSKLSDVADSEARETTFAQFVADNVDHNVRTLDGCNTFHGMGIISVSTKKTVDSAVCGNYGRVPRLLARMKVRDVCRNKGTVVVPCRVKPGSGLSCVMLKNIRSLQCPVVLPPVTNLSLLWHAYALCPAADLARPNWSGYMQTVCIGDHSPVASVQMLPIIDLKPTDESCIYSTLLFVVEQAKKVTNSVPCVTFDQPLYIKAVDISKSADLKIVCRLGGFHTLMNFLGAIGYVMKGSGLEELMGQLYGPNTLDHVMSGKAFARAIRGHIIIHDALVQLLLKCVVDDNYDYTSGPVVLESDKDLGFSVANGSDIADVIKELYRSTWNEKVTVTDCSILECECLQEIDFALQKLKHCLAEQSRTSRLWVQYMEHVDLLKLFIVAERTSDWSLHLMTCYRMLALFAAAGHYNYAKSCRLYVQQMLELSNTHPELHNNLSTGNHTIRRSDRLWAGLSCDLVIEQTLMKSVKGRGGLTHGRGMHDTVRHVWTNTMTDCASIHFAMSAVTGFSTSMSDHVEVAAARVRRDGSDLAKVNNYLLANSPFRFLDSSNLVSLLTGVVAGPDDHVNCEVADEVGLKIQQKWDNATYGEISARKRDKVKTLSHLTNSCLVDKKQIHVDVNRLFHRLIVLAERSADICGFFKFELTQYPTSLFSNGFMRKPDKPALYRRVAADMMSETLPFPCIYVVDGGCLLHRVRWVRGKTCEQLLEQYVTFVKCKFGDNAVVVFDGYGTPPSTKDHEHKRRQGKYSKIAPDVNLEATKQIMFDQDHFMANSRNKAAFIDMLSLALRCNGVVTRQSCGDADTNIVSEALQLASSGYQVTVYCDDTDVLNMLLFHRLQHMPDIFFWSEARKRAAGKCVNIRCLQTKLGYDMCKQVLVLHALGGCDSTSAVFGCGKGTILTKLGNDAGMRSNIEVMQDVSATHDQVGRAGLQLLIAVYGGKNVDSLDNLRYLSYVRLVSSSLGRLLPEKLPPTERAAYFHALRVHLQTVEWQTLSCNTLLPTDWGWKLEAGHLVPITTDLPVAPDEILHVVRCGCKTSCSSALCSCRKNGLKCMSACRCHGHDCSNNESELMSSEADCCDLDGEVIMDDDIDWVEEETVA